MLFDFHLSPLDEVHPWGKPPDLSLSWFGFTEGSYRLQVGSEFLLNYSDEIVDHWAEKNPDIKSGPFVDYYVVRLWEDILDLLPDALEPLPKEISKFFEKDKNAWFQWENDALTWVDSQSDEEQALEVFELAVWWQRDRRLDAGYLQNSPRIWIWTTEESVIISWDNTDILLDDIQVWSATQGHYCIQRDDFLNEVRDFHSKLMSEMAERVDQVCARWHRPEIQVDTAQLKDEQQDRKTWLDRALHKPASTDWAIVLAAIEAIPHLSRLNANSGPGVDGG
jgi:Family of unknown function (DUF5984)